MYRICIADDEVYVQKSIIQRIANSGLDMEVVGTAANGFEALALYEEESPDIFFVDINMPVINGLDFIEKVRKQRNAVDTQFVIISGYDDFAYMKRAIRLGVVNYIKKPILQQEFQEMLLEIEQKLSEKRGRERPHSQKSAGTWSEFMEQGRAERMTGSLILVWKTMAQDAAEEFLSALRKTEHTQWQAVTFGKEMPDICILFLEGELLREQELDKICRAGPFCEGNKVLYWSGKNQHPEEMLIGMEALLNLRFYGETAQVMRYREPERERLSVMYDAFESALETGQEELCREALGKIWNTVFGDRKYVYLIKQVYQSVLLVLANKYMKYDIPLPIQIRKGLFPFAVCRYQNKKELTDELVEYAGELNQKIVLASSGCDLVDKVVRYMEQYYREDISLSELAATFFVVPTYLARRFKEKKSCTVMQYLEDIRLRKARELLENSRMSIQEVALLVGYKDQNYFARSFRKVYGMSPREYRNLNG